MYPVFSETQWFRIWWLWALLTAVIGSVSLDLVLLLLHHAAVGDIIVRVIALLIPIVLMVSFFLLRLKTRIDRTGIYYRFHPLQKDERVIEWGNVSNVYVRKYRPIREYGGWGIRYSSRNGEARNMSGNQGIQLVFTNGKKLLIGTQKPEEVKNILIELKKEGIINNSDSTAS